jgi:hypothetical protein
MHGCQIGSKYPNVTRTRRILFIPVMKWELGTARRLKSEESNSLLQSIRKESSTSSLQSIQRDSKVEDCSAPVQAKSHGRREQAKVGTQAGTHFSKIRTCADVLCLQGDGELKTGNPKQRYSIHTDAVQQRRSQCFVPLHKALDHYYGTHNPV